MMGFNTADDFAAYTADAATIENPSGLSADLESNLATLLEQAENESLSEREMLEAARRVIEAKWTEFEDIIRRRTEFGSRPVRRHAKGVLKRFLAQKAKYLRDIDNQLAACIEIEQAGANEFLAAFD